MPDALLAIEGVNAYYAGAQALRDVSFEIAGRRLDHRRNGMGKTTLCNAMWHSPAAGHGSIRFRGKELVGQPSYKIAKLASATSRRATALPSLSVRRHLRMISARGGSKALDGRTRVRALSPVAGAQAQRGCATLRRRATDARNRGAHCSRTRL